MRRIQHVREVWREGLAQPVDGASLAVMRIGFGAIITWEVWRAFDGNLITADYELPDLHFTWWLFSWVKPFPGAWLYVVFAAIGVAAFLLTIGAFTRLAAAATCAGITYWFLMEKAAYLNHRYLAALLAFLLAFVPAGARWSVDARRRGDRFVGAWSIWLMRFQVGVPYFFAGVAKLNYDWLIRAEPLGAALRDHAGLPLVGGLLAKGATAHVLAVGSMALDLFLPFFLLHRRTRLAAFAFALAFHLINSRLFDIGMFPWMMIVATTLFFEPDWPVRAVAALRRGHPRTRAAITAGFAIGFVAGGFVPETFALVRAVVGGFGVATLAFHLRPDAAKPPENIAPSSRHGVSRVLAGFLVAWVAVQLLLPVRHFVIPGNVHWTEEGNRFAWHMLLRRTRATITIEVVDPATGRSWDENLATHLTRYQISKLRYPDVLHEFAHHLEAFYRRQGIRDIEVHANVTASLNGRQRQRLVRQHVDLTTMDRPYLGHADWVLPLKPYEETRSGRESRRNAPPRTDREGPDR